MDTASQVETPELYYPLWSEMRSMPFRRSPYPTSTFEMAVGDAEITLAREAILSAKAGSLLRELQYLITLEDQPSYRWTPTSGLWLSKHPLSEKFDEPTWRGRSLVKRADFIGLWEGRVAPYLHALSRSEEGEP